MPRLTPSTTHRLQVRGTRALRSARGDDGFSSLELVIITPVVLAMLLLVVGFGRLTHGRQLVQDAAAAGARAATLDSNPVRADADARQAAHDILAQGGISCQTFSTSVNTADFRPGGQVSVSITCTVGLSDLGLVGFPGSKTMTASATSPLDQFRQYGSG